MTSPPVLDAAPRPLPRHRSDRVFAWTAGLGLIRSEAWLGGVCAGVASRMRIDPLIVRGIVVVATLFGLPMLLVYALAWALLPDLDGRIHARDLLRGRFQPVQVAIAALALLGLVPTVPATALLLGVPLNPGYSSGWWTLATIGFIIGTILVIGLVLLIVRAARRTPGLSPAEPRTASAAAPDPGPVVSPAGSGPAGDTDGTAAVPIAQSAAADANGAEPDAMGVTSVDDAPMDAPVLADAATPAEVQAWREQHAAWKEQDQAWRRQQQDADRIARDQARRERQAHAAAFAIEAAERRRIRRMSNPRTSAAFVAFVIGAALVAGAICALAVVPAAAAGTAAGLGFFVAALVTGGAMVVAGAVRRRSGFLAFTTVLLLIGGLVGLAVPGARELGIGDYTISNTHGTYPPSAPFRQTAGTLTVSLTDTGQAAPPIHVVKRSGGTTLYVQEGVALDLEATVAGDVSIGVALEDGWLPLADAIPLTRVSDGTLRFAGTLSAVAEPTTTQQVVLSQDSGWIEVFLSGATEKEITRVEQ